VYSQDLPYKIIPGDALDLSHLAQAFAVPHHFFTCLTKESKVNWLEILASLLSPISMISGRHIRKGEPGESTKFCRSAESWRGETGTVDVKVDSSREARWK
jgi:hypothetical protein